MNNCSLSWAGKIARANDAVRDFWAWKRAKDDLFQAKGTRRIAKRQQEEMEYRYGIRFTTASIIQKFLQIDVLCVLQVYFTQ